MQGVTGAAIARELSRYNLKIVVLDKENDVSCGTSKANSAIIHAGYDPEENTLMAKFNSEEIRCSINYAQNLMFRLKE